MKQLLTFVMIAILAIFTLNGCKNGKKEEENVIKIGVILPLSGKQSVAGEVEKNGMLLALDSINYAGQKLDIIFEDFKSEVKNAPAAANKLINVDNVDAIITSSTAACEAVTPIVAKNKIPHFTYSPDLNIVNKSDYNYRVFYSIKTESKLIIDFAVTRNVKSVSFLAVDYISMRNQIDNFLIPEFEDNGIHINTIEYFDFNSNDFKNSILKAKHSKPDLLILIPHISQIETLTNQMIEMDFLPNSETIFLGTFPYNWMAKGTKEKLTGYCILTPAFNTFKNSSEFAKAYVERFDNEANFDAMYAYDNIIILYELLQEAMDKDAPFSDLYKRKNIYNGASGEILLGDNRDSDVQIEIVCYE